MKLLVKKLHEVRHEAEDFSEKKKPQKTNKQKKKKKKKAGLTG